MVSIFNAIRPKKWSCGVVKATSLWVTHSHAIRYWRNGIINLFLVVSLSSVCFSIAFHPWENFFQCADFVFTDFDFINNVNTSAVKINDKETIDVRIIVTYLDIYHIELNELNDLNAHDFNFIRQQLQLLSSLQFCDYGGITRHISPLACFRCCSKFDKHKPNNSGPKRSKWKNSMFHHDFK